MKTPRFALQAQTWLAVAAIVVLAPSAGAQVVTNWVAFNDHHPGNTAPNVTAWNMRVTGEGGVLRNFDTGEDLPVMMTITSVGSPDDFGANNYPNADTPAYNLFNGIVDVGNSGLAGVRASPPNASRSTVTITFEGLDPFRLYKFRGTISRGNNYVDRWSVFTIQEADAFVDAHVDGSKRTNIFTKATYPACTLTNGQVALNSGENREGSLVGWDNIAPGEDGRFSILAEQYTGRAPFGTPAAAQYGYGLNAIYLVEFESTAPQFRQQPGSTAVAPGQPATFNVVISGRGAFQWQKASPGAAEFVNIPGATAATYTTPPTTVADSGTKFRVIVSGEGEVLTSFEATLTVDATPLTLSSIAGSPTFNRVTVVFSKAVSPGTATDPANYAISGLTIESASLDSDGKTVTLATSLQTTGAVYTATVRNIQDNLAAGAHTISPNPTTARFTGWVLAVGGVLHKYWTNITPQAISSLTSDPRFPAEPSFSTIEPRFEYPANGGEEGGSTYANQMIAWLVPPVSGDYIFYCNGDDQVELYLSSDASPDLKALIASESQWNPARQWLAPDRRAIPPENRSAPIPLEAGNLYYIEALHVEGTGGDNLGVAWEIPGGSPLANGDPPIEGRYLMTYINPDTLRLEITQQPANTSVPVNSSVTFSVRYTASADFGTNAFVQWQKAAAGSSTFVAIAGATGADLLVPFADPADNGAKFRAVLTIGSLAKTTSEATLTLTADTSKPALVGVSGSGNTVQVRFSEPVEAGSAATAKNYTLDQGVTVSAAALVPDPQGATTVLLTVNGAAPGIVYVLTVNNVKDRANNTIAPNSRLSFALANLFYDFNDGVAPPDTVFIDPAVVLPTGGVQDSGVLQLTSSAGSLSGACLIGDPVGMPVNGFIASFKLFIGRGSGNPADGFSFNFAPDLPDLPLGEEGAGTGLTIAFDTYDNGGGEAPAIDVKFGGTVLASRPVSKATLVNNRFVEVFIQVGLDGTLDLVHDGVVYYARFPIPGWTPVIGGRFGLGARTGGEYETHLVDDLSILALTGDTEPSGAILITRQPQNTTVVENTPATFTVLATGSNPAFTYQWQKASPGGAFSDISGATSATFLTAPIALGESGTRYRVVLTARGGSIATSAEATVTVGRDTAPPTLVSAERDYIGVRTVKVLFSETLQTASANTTANYRIDHGISVFRAALAADGKTVVLTTSGIADGASNILTVSGVRDLAGNPIADNSQTTIGFAVPNILFVVGSLSLGAGDNAINAKLANRNYNVTLRTGTAVATEDALGKNLVILSSTAAAADIDAKFTSVPVPVLNWNQAVQPLLLMTDPTGTADRGTVGSQTSLDIVNTNHLMAAGLDLGTYTVAGGGGQTFSWGAPSPDAIVIATITGNPSQAAIYLYEKDTPLFDGTFAPDKRIMFYYQNNAASSQAGEAARLFDTTLEYALGMIGGTVTPLPPILSFSLAGNQLTISWDPPGGTLQSSARVDGGWQDEPAGPNPRVVSVQGSARFFRVKQ